MVFCAVTQRWSPAPCYHPTPSVRVPIDIIRPSNEAVAVIVAVVAAILDACGRVEGYRLARRYLDAAIFAQDMDRLLSISAGWADLWNSGGERYSDSRY